MLTRLKQLLFERKRQPSLNAESLRIEFNGRYHNFKLLLNANNCSLEMMADIEKALKGREP